MRILHHISKRMDAAKQAELRRLGIDVQVRDLGIGTFDFYEDDPRWEEVRRLVKEWRCVDMVGTEFTDSERSDARYLEMAPAWHHGYPQPTSKFGYRKETYDLTNYCATCGVGKKQITPFRMSGEPEWGKRQILQLFWVYDEFFVQPQVWTDVFRPFGIDCRPAIHHSTGNELKTVVQLDVRESDSLRQMPQYDGFPKVCAVCSRRKGAPYLRGFNPPLQAPVTASICRTTEYFGDGALAFNKIIVQKPLFDAIRNYKLSGVVFNPLAADISLARGESGETGTY